MAVAYDIKAHPTVYEGRQYRSRLEAKWAAFFDRLGWQYEYEPIDLGAWSPDFSLRGSQGPIYVEVKPIDRPDEDTMTKMAQYPGEHLLLGLSPFAPGGWMCGRAMGWFVNGADLHMPGEHGGPVCIMGTPSGYDFCCYTIAYDGRITGYYDGNSSEADAREIERLWSDAANAVQWRKR